jgi:hypothetical protein
VAAALAASGRIAFSCGGTATIRITRLPSITRSIEIDGGGQIWWPPGEMPLVGERHEIPEQMDFNLSHSLDAI